MLDRKPSWERYWDGAQYWCESLGEVLAEQLPYLEKIPSLAEKQAEGQKYPRDEVTDPKIEQSRRRGRARQHKIIRRAVGRLASDVTKQRREAAGSWGPWGRKSQEEIDCFRKHLKSVIKTLETISSTLENKHLPHVKRTGAENHKSGKEESLNSKTPTKADTPAVPSTDDFFVDSDYDSSSGDSAVENENKDVVSSSHKLVGWGELVVDGNKELKIIERNHDIKNVACSGHRGLYVTYTGDVYRFGDSGTGMPPDVRADFNVTRNSPKVVPELVLERVLMGQRVVTVACGHLHSVAITQEGRLWSWGCGSDGRLGHGDEIDQVTPRLCEALMDMQVRSVGCGGVHTVAVVSPSRVYSWGLGRHGRLGLGDDKQKSHSVPQLVNVDDHALALSQTYHAFFGRKLPSAVKNSCDEPIKAVACGWAFTLLLGANGTVRAFGAGKDGQCGLLPAKDRLQPVTVNFGDEFKNDGVEITQVSCGYHHALAVDNIGRVWSWGSGEVGQIGQGRHSLSSLTPKVLQFPSIENGEDSTSNGCPKNSNESTSDFSTSKAGTAAKRKVICEKVSAGQFHSVAIMQNKTTWGWGSNKHGAVVWKTESEQNDSIFVPTQIPVSAINVAAGADYTIAVIRKEKPQKDSDNDILEDLEYPDVNSGISCAYCGGRIFLWDTASETFLPRIGVLTSDCVLELYTELSSIHPVERFPIYCGPHLVVNQWNNIVEIWRTYPGWEYTLLFRFRCKSLTHAQEWKLQLLRKRKNAPPPPVEPRIDQNPSGVGIREFRMGSNRALASWSSFSQLGHVNWHALENSRKSNIRSSIGSLSERRTAWKAAIGNALKVTPELFLIYKERAQATRQDGIGMDVRRTLPRLLLFGKRGEPLFEQLRDVLEVYRCYRPDVGYVQGMSYVAAMLCLHIPDNEYECFMCLANLLASHHCFDFFRLAQSYNRIELVYEITDICLEKNSKQLFKHLKKIEGLRDVHTIYFQQLQTLFVRNLPIEQATLLWDAFLRDGSVVMIRACVAVLLLLESKILQTDFSGELMRLLMPMYKGIDVCKKVNEVVVPKRCIMMLNELQNKVV